jgi:hypothetical protein
MRCLVGIVLAGCYAPARVAECTVTCDRPGASCGDGLTCGDNHLCYATTPCAGPALDAAPMPDMSCGGPGDLDDDCILDAMDDCIAPAADSLGDLDGDGVLNGMDPCPWDKMTTGDPDGDHVPSPCDPFGSNMGDQQRCLMAFSSPALTNALWRPRGTDIAWTAGPNQIAGNGSGLPASILSQRSLDGANATTYDVVVDLPTASSTAFVVWLRSGTSPSSKDVGCEISGGFLQILGQGSSFSAQPIMGLSDPALVRIRATIMPNNTTNVRCIVQVPGNTPAENLGQMTLFPGNLAFTVTENATIHGLVIYDRTIPPPSL